MRVNICFICVNSMKGYNRKLLKTNCLNKWVVYTITVVILVTIYIVYLMYSHILEYYLNYYFMYHNITLGPSSSKNLILLSNSTMTGLGTKEHLGYVFPILKKFFKPFNTTKILFIPYAYPDVRDGVDTHSATDFFTEVQTSFKKLGIEAILLDMGLPPNRQKEEIKHAEAIYICGGNTHNLLKNINDNDVLGILKSKINSGIPFIGVSAGTVIHGPTIKTTNDMPVVSNPKGLDSLGSVPFQINAHYINPISIGYGGETRDDRLKEFLQYNRNAYGKSSPNAVIGLREGTMIHVSGNQAELVGFGTRPAEHFYLGDKDVLIKKQIPVGTRLDYLMNI